MLLASRNTGFARHPCLAILSTGKMTDSIKNWGVVTDFIQSHSCGWSLKPTYGEWGIHHLDYPPYNQLLGPVFERGEAAGLVALNGQIQCQWGDIHRPDMTFSVTKSYLALTTGVALDQGLLTDLDQSVHTCLSDRGIVNTGFESIPNSNITWRQLLQFTSEWSGECFGVPDQVDHHRFVSMQPGSSSDCKGDARALAAPGTHWEYNDIRINQFSLALMRLFDRPLPEVFDEFIMSPLKASNQWHWYGYDNSWIETESGQCMQSVPGGGHWGGGMVISAHDQYLIAQLMINGGIHEGRELISGEWLKQMCTPCDIAPWYGFFTWLNTGNVVSQFASEQSYFAMGIGGQLIWHDPVSQLVVVLRWIDTEYQEQMIERIAAALRQVGS